MNNYNLNRLRKGNRKRSGGVEKLPNIDIPAIMKGIEMNGRKKPNPAFREQHNPEPSIPNRVRFVVFSNRWYCAVRRDSE
jgi:hypothetical protein